MQTRDQAVLMQAAESGCQCWKEISSLVLSHFFSNKKKYCERLL